MGIAVTVVVPTYKRIDYLKQALASVQSQTFQDYECIVVNNYPPYADKLDELIAGIGDQRFRVIHNEVNAGECFSRNRGIQSAQGDVIAFLDDDDVWLPNHLALSADKHKQDPGVGIVYTGYIAKWQDDIIEERIIQTPIPPENVKEEMLKGNFTLHLSSVATIKKQCFERAGGFDDKVVGFPDWDMWLRIVEHYGIDYIEEPTVRFRLHLGTRQSTSLQKRLKGIRSVVEKWGQYKEIQHFQLKYKMEAYYYEMKNLMLLEDRGRFSQVFWECMRECRVIHPSNYRVFLKMLAMYAMGPSVVRRFSY